MKDLGTKTLETDRLILRKFEENDYKKMFANWANDPDVAHCVTWYAHENTEETKKIVSMWIEEYNNEHTYNWIVVEKNSGEPIGNISVVKKSLRDSRCEIGYCYGKNWWKKGYGTEALKAVIEFLFNEVEFELITSDHLISNPASGRVMEKSGMKKVGLLPKWVINKNNEREDLVLYEILNN